MGTFRKNIIVGHPDGGDLTEVSALADTGAIHTVLPTSLLEHRNIRPIANRVFTTAMGEPVEREIGQARIVYEGESMICTVIFGNEDIYLLGATTLENFELTVDPIDQKLVPQIIRDRPF